MMRFASRMQELVNGAFGNQLAEATEDYGLVVEPERHPRLRDPQRVQGQYCQPVPVGCGKRIQYAYDNRELFEATGVCRRCREEDDHARQVLQLHIWCKFSECRAEETIETAWMRQHWREFPCTVRVFANEDRRVRTARAARQQKVHGSDEDREGNYQRNFRQTDPVA